MDDLKRVTHFARQDEAMFAECINRKNTAATTNNKIKLGIRTAFGFRNPHSLIAMVMLTCSAVHPRLPGR